MQIQFKKYKKRIRRLCKNDCIAVLCGASVILLAVIGSVRIADYGVSYDEPLEYRTSAYTWEYVKATLGQLVRGEAITDTTGFFAYSDNVYGCAARLPVFLLMKNSISTRNIFLGWHIYTWCWFLVAVFAVYALLKELGFGNRSSWMGSMMYLLMPRLAAEASYNIKDSLFLSLFTITLYLGLRVLKKPSVLSHLLFSFMLALCMNTRYIGAVAAFPLILFVLLWRREGKAFRNLLILFLETLLFYYILTPFLWTDPLERVIQLIASFTNNEERYVSMWFAGQQLGADELPWYYLILWMGITIPLWILCAFFAGIVVGLRQLAGGIKPDIRAVWLLGTAVLLAMALLADAVMHTIKYDGWRHFYFLYALIVPVAVYGLDNLARKMSGMGKKIGISLLCISMVSDLFWPVCLHPYQMVYMNPIGMAVNQEFETDYWLVSMTGAIRELLSETEGPVKIWLGWETGLYMLTEEESTRVIPVESIHDADYVIMYDRVYRWNGMEPGELGGFDIWKEKRIGNGLLYHILIPQNVENIEKRGSYGGGD